MQPKEIKKEEDKSLAILINNKRQRSPKFCIKKNFKEHITNPEEIRKTESEYYEQLCIRKQIIPTYTNSYRELKKTEHFPAHSMGTVEP